MALVLVGATIVASIETIWAGNIAPTKQRKWYAGTTAATRPSPLQKAPRWGCSSWAAQSSACLAPACWPVSEPHLANGVTTRMGQPFATLAAQA